MWMPINPTPEEKEIFDKFLKEREKQSKEKLKARKLAHKEKAAERRRQKAAEKKNDVGSKKPVKEVATTASVPATPPSVPKSEKEVLELMTALKVPKNSLRKLSRCLLAGILNGHVLLSHPDKDPTDQWGLNQVLCKGECISCGKELQCTIKKILYQGDLGHDYEEGSPAARVSCSRDCGKLYVSDICEGQPTFSCGKDFNHCSEHERFGECLGDYRTVHCRRCGNHYHSNPYRPGPCPMCEPEKEKERYREMGINLSWM